MLTLVVEDGTGLSTANTAISRGDAAVRLEERPHATTWAALSDENQDRYLVRAARLLAQEIIARGWRWRGELVATDQALPMPRTGLYTSEGSVVDDDVVPDAFIDAQCEIALLLMDTDLEKAAQERIESSVNLKSASVSYAIGTVPVVPDRVLIPLLPFIDTNRRTQRG